MKTILLGILLFTFLIVAILFFNDYFVKQKFRNFIAKKYKAIQGIKHQLESKEIIDAIEILNLVKQPGLRHAVYQMLQAYDMSALFPADYFTHEKGAESFLVTWLEYPTELGRAPDEIELLTKITLEENGLDYYVFKYRTIKPKWAAKLNWMMGVTGPYSTNSSPYDVPKRIFSRFNTVNSVSPKNEVTWVHQNINQG